MNEMPTSEPSVLIDWNDSLNTDSIAVFASNDCGNSDTTYFKVTCNNLRIRSPHSISAVQQVKLFPNPTNGTVTVIYNITGEKGSFLVRDMLGRVVKKYELNGNNQQYVFDLSNLSNGLMEWVVYDEASIAGKGLLSITK
jgi:hypothetical protein